MTSIDTIRLKVKQLKDETGNTLSFSPDDTRKIVLKTTYEVLDGLEEALSSYRKE